MGLVYNPITGQLDKVKDQTSGSAVWVRGSATISASTTSNLDTILNSAFNSAKYIVSAISDANNRYRSEEISILNANGSYKEAVANKIKDGNLNIDYTTVNNAGTMELQVTNNESFDVAIGYAKLIINN